ncbi:MAG: recombinase family protein [Candidatus Moranbacteria bacterium]|nr:recombinase family protein [Candidatus Moranbacteria bacterium]
MQKFFLYARKSTDVEDKQVLSIEAQITELREFAKRENLDVVEEFIEKQSAKIPGRSIFNSMLEKIEKGEVSGIISWHPDRLARNSVDGGKIIYLLDCGHLEMLKFPQFWFEPTPQGKFMLNIAFGQSKYYVDSLSENTKRGLRQKVRRGEYPTLAPMGYINDSRTKMVIVDKKKSAVICKAFELYAENNSRLEDISDFLAQNGIVSKKGNRLHRDRISYLLSNPFYIGLFRYSGEIHEGKHQPVISNKIFDKVQEVLKQRGKPR